MSDLPRLLLCSFDVVPGPSGSSRRLTEYLKALPDRFSVVVISVKTPDHSHIEKYEGARLLRVPVGAGDIASRIQTFERAVRRQLESEEYALAHFTDPFGGYALCELKGDYGYRLLYEAQAFPSQELRYTHPHLEGDRKFLSKVRRQELFCLMNADLVLTGSPTTRAFIHSLGVSQDAVREVRAPVDLGPYVPEALGAPDGDPMRLMYLGSQVSWQGLPGLLRGLALAVRQVDVRLTLVGARHPDWQPHLEELVAELGLKEHVELQPPVVHDDVAKVLALADVGVLPLEDVDRNRVQGGPLAKVSEYLAAGRPVLAADLPVTRQLVPAPAGVFYPPGDARALAERIIELARDVPRRIALGKQARAHAERWLDAGLIRGQLLDIYDGLLGRRQVPVGAPPERELNPTMTGTPTSRIPEPAPRMPVQEPPASEPPPPDTDPALSGAPREELPLILGQALQEKGLDSRLIKTELEAAQPEGPPVVMGLPLRDSNPPEPAMAEQDSPLDAPPLVRGQPLRESASSDNALTEQEARPGGAPVVMGMPLREPSAPPPLAPSRSVPSVKPPPLESARPPALPPRPRSSLSIPALPPLPGRPAGSPIPPPPLKPAEAPASPPPLARAPSPSRAEEPEELAEAEIEELEEVDASPTPPHAPPLEEPEEISSEEIEEAESPEQAPREPPESGMNAWFAQLAHGYCPPEGTRFARHTPPTTFPGRDEEPIPGPAPRVQVASPSKPS